jgi:hypothetical protein
MPLNRPECRPQKFVMVTQVAAGRLVPPFNPRASRCHPPIHPGESVPPPNPPAGMSGWCHPSVRLRQGPPGSPNQCHPSARNSATRQFRAPRRTESVAKMVPPASSEGRLVPGWLMPAANLVPPPNSEWPTGATPQFGSASLVPPPNPGGGSGVIDPGLSAQCRAGWCQPSIRPTARMVPLVNSERRQPGATSQLGMANWCHPPIRGAEVASSIRASPPRIAPVRPL